jgi:hypothetical protein
MRRGRTDGSGSTPNVLQLSVLEVSMALLHRLAPAIALLTLACAEKVITPDTCDYL